MLPSSESTPQLILDTHAYIWLLQGEAILSHRAKDRILKICPEGRIGICAISLWEISMLHTRKRIYFNQPCLNWIQMSLEAPGIILYPLTPEVSVESCVLPGSFTGDPASRLIIASARLLGVPLVTRDENILKYAREGHVTCIEA